jgi:hypothetical protein
LDDKVPADRDGITHTMAFAAPSNGAACAAPWLPRGAGGKIRAVSAGQSANCEEISFSSTNCEDMRREQFGGNAVKAKVKLGKSVRQANVVPPVKEVDLALAIAIFRTEYKKALVREEAFQNGTELPGLPVSEAEFDAAHWAPEDAALGLQAEN